MSAQRSNADAVAKIFSQCRDEVDVAWHNPDRVPYLRLQYVMDVVLLQHWNPQGPRTIILRCGKLPAQRNEAHWEGELRRFLQVSTADLRFQYAECVPGRCLHIDSTETTSAEASSKIPATELPVQLIRWMTLTRDLAPPGNNSEPALQPAEDPHVPQQGAHQTLGILRWQREFPMRPHYIVQWRRDSEVCEASTSFPMLDITRRTFALSTLNDTGQLMVRRERDDYQLQVSCAGQEATEISGQWQIVEDTGTVSFGPQDSPHRIHICYSVVGEIGKQAGA